MAALEQERAVDAARSEVPDGTFDSAIGDATSGDATVSRDGSTTVDADGPMTR